MISIIPILFLGLHFNSVIAAPYTMPYRYPTESEFNSNKNITISSQPITYTDIFIEKGVLEYLVNNNFFKAHHFRLWNRLSQLTVLSPRQAISMMRLKKREAKSLRRFQRQNGLPETGVIDTPVITIIFPITCGTLDYVDESDSDGFGDVALKKKY
jgi:hypothetical protein